VWGLSPIGATLAGVVADLTDIRAALAAGAVLALAVSTTVFVRRPALRTL
jgi:hypothetical protein